MCQISDRNLGWAKRSRNPELLSKNVSERKLVLIFSGERREWEEKMMKWGKEGPTRQGGAPPLLAAPACGVPPWGAPLVIPRCSQVLRRKIGLLV